MRVCAPRARDHCEEGKKHGADYRSTLEGECVIGKWQRWHGFHTDCRLVGEITDSLPFTYTRLALPNRTHNSRFIYPISSFSRRLFFPLASFPAPNTSLPFPSHTALPSPSPHLFLLSSPSSLLRPSFSLSLLLLSPLQSIPPPIGVDLDVPQTSSGPRRANARCTSASGGSASWPTRPAWSAQRSPAARHTPYQRQRPQHSRRHERPCSRASSARRAPPCRHVARGAACGSSGRRSGRWARKRSGGGAGICTPCDSEAHESERGDVAVDRCVVPCPCTPSPWFCVLFPLRLGFVFRMTPCPSLSG